MKRLSPRILRKLSTKTGRSEKSLRERISRKASQLGISSEAVLILLAKESGLGINNYRRSLSPHIQSEVQHHVKDINKVSPIVVNNISKKRLIRNNNFSLNFSLYVKEVKVKLIELTTSLIPPFFHT